MYTNLMENNVSHDNLTKKEREKVIILIFNRRKKVEK